MHGPTFMANPLACSVALASLNILKNNQWVQQTQMIESIFADELPKLREYNIVHDVRWLGAIGVVETKQPVNMERIQANFVKQGVWIRPFGKLIYVMPPYIASPDNIYHLLAAIENTLKHSENFI